MSDANKVVWSEGLFLRPQHMQQQDRHTESLVRGAMQAAPHQNFGFRDLTLDDAAIQAGQVGMTYARGIFPDGTPFAMPDMTTGLQAVTVTAGTKSGLVSFGVPALKPGTATIDPQSGGLAGGRYHGQIDTIRDTIKGGADAAEIEVARLAPRLFLPGEATDGYTVLPVARINGLLADGSVAIDADFLAPSLVTSACPWYAGFLQEVLTGLDRIAQAHGGIVMGGAGASVENLLILELANTARPRIAHMMAQDLFHPSELFMELAGLAGRMATFGSSSRSMSELPVYEHNDPQAGFAALTDTLRSLILSLRHVEVKNHPLKVARHDENVWTVRIDNTDIINNSRIVLRIGGEMSEAMLRKIFVEQATVGAADEFDALWKSKLTGIPLKPLHSQPREIPYDGERLCLELDRNSEHWAKLADAPGFVIGVAGKLDKAPLIDCYAVKR
ncbi:type VI secretion system baseplate subunit TssK [Yoonia sediminilitoris]|uniref:Type VI secretion system protein ImpJ n=1 Tax=Yoonia sediminilitoris TaxID=1286148 RepID=A0A2T6KM35_9RHOB|nr:type VI secretion system baseplate subunit TssK [Yoonia sediminilitoris]PUB17278.1 type VI secretion system protein ImpJ [Yoonia sediminilitoris]RCW97573.1 type VI secretion system protein ImpJ [Yoonia sediminilitoris]